MCVYVIVVQVHSVLPDAVSLLHWMLPAASETESPIHSVLVAPCGPQRSLLLVSVGGGGGGSGAVMAGELGEGSFFFGGGAKKGKEGGWCV